MSPLANPALTDPLAGALLPERLHYHTGVMLDREDFRAEQADQRGRLARLARYLHGQGTAAGLEALYEPALAPTPLDAGHEARVNVAPGLAIDRLGRNALDMQSTVRLLTAGLRAALDSAAVMKRSIHMGTHTRSER